MTAQLLLGLGIGFIAGIFTMLAIGAVLDTGGRTPPPPGPRRERVSQKQEREA